MLKKTGCKHYYAEDYEGALGSFEDVLEINQLDLFAGEVGYGYGAVFWHYFQGDCKQDG